MRSSQLMRTTCMWKLGGAISRRPNRTSPISTTSRWRTSTTALSSRRVGDMRCVASRSIAVSRRTKVSNVQLDGTVLPVGGSNPLQPKRTYIGMQPLEVYTCGENEVRDVAAVFLADDKYNGRFAAIVRGREAFRTCDVGEVKDGQWTRLEWGDPDFYQREAVEDGHTARHDGGANAGHLRGADAMSMAGTSKARTRRWTTTRRRNCKIGSRRTSFATWDDMLKAHPRREARMEMGRVGDTSTVSRIRFWRARLRTRSRCRWGPVGSSGPECSFKAVEIDGGDLLVPPGAEYAIVTGSRRDGFSGQSPGQMRRTVRRGALSSRVCRISLKERCGEPERGTGAGLNPSLG